VGISPSPASAPDAPTSASARALAFDTLRTVLEQKRPLDDVLEDNSARDRLAPRDRAFARLLVATTLRRLGQIDRVIDGCLDRPLPRRAAAVGQLLRLGICQLLFLDTPPHAAVDTTVELIAARGGEAGFKGLINAILRRVDRERAAWLEQTADPSLNAPAWLWESWVATYGPGRTAEIAAAHLREAPLDLTAKGDPAIWRDRLGATLLPTGSLRMPLDGLVESLPGFAEGAWWVQDAAAALPARLLGDVAGKRVIDLCAAPGGKTAQLAAASADVVAIDRSAPRLERLRRNLTRLDLQAATVVADAAAWQPDQPADAVLLDAPCSATGTIRRHPDVPWLKRPEDVAKLAALQARLLRAAIAMIKPGGTIVFCTCSLQPEEGPAQVAALLQEGAEVERLRIQPSEVGGIDSLIDGKGDLRTLPCHLAEQGGIDGFFAARLRRR
jgi:16S rRNA (cytosine967-C5)-methyltransferase